MELSDNLSLFTKKNHNIPELYHGYKLNK
jgi:hypothetical protein